MKITTHQQIVSVIERMGYEARIHEGAVIVKIGSSTTPFIAVITTSEQNLTITCQLCKFDQIPEDNQAAFFYAALNKNTEINPFAFAILSTESDNAEEDLVVLTDRLPLGDLSPEELMSAMEALEGALINGRAVLQLGFAGVEFDDEDDDLLDAMDAMNPQYIVDDIVDMDPMELELLAEGVRVGSNAAMNAMETIGNAVIDTAESIGDGVLKVGGGIAEGISDIASGIGDAAGSTFD